MSATPMSLVDKHITPSYPSFQKMQATVLRANASLR